MDNTTTIGAGRTLFKEGDKCRDLYIIKKGEVQLTVRNKETGEDVEIAIKKDSSVLGTMAFLEGDPRSATAKTITEIVCTKVTEPVRDRLIKTIPNWFKILIKDMTNNIHNQNEAFLKQKQEIEELKKCLILKDKQKARLEEKIKALESELSQEKGTHKESLEKSKKEEMKLKQMIEGLNQEITKLKKGTQG